MNCVIKALTEEGFRIAIIPFSRAPREKWSMESSVYNFKVVVLGDAGVGKTSLVKVFATGKFDRNYIPTLGVNILTKDMNFKDIKVTLVIWDLAGQGFMENVRAQYYAGALAAILVYDVTSYDTFTGVVHWDDECKRFSPNMLLKTVVGNKVDLESERKVPANDGMTIAKKLNANFFETSALSGANVESMFNSCGKDLLKNQLAFLMKKISILQG
jgi:small GTP-binding protein